LKSEYALHLWFKFNFIRQLGIVTLRKIGCFSTISAAVSVAIVAVGRVSHGRGDGQILKVLPNGKLRTSVASRSSRRIRETTFMQ
jgi:hypothetical protein